MNKWKAHWKHGKLIGNMYLRSKKWFGVRMVVERGLQAVGSLLKGEVRVGQRTSGLERERNPRRSQ